MAGGVLHKIIGLWSDLFRIKSFEINRKLQCNPQLIKSQLFINIKKYINENI